ncbi:unnamed protein product [marine sediment metagenome]|uniref:Uncharacterized protein n=1 Tax=marine sediment metagenome TaxID=412755 RepID=X1UC28_9ZZZZ
MKKTKIEHGQCIDSFETKQEDLKEDGGIIKLKGWNIRNPNNTIIAELQEHLEKNIINFQIVEWQEMAYSCSRYYDGSDAQDEGFAFWVFFYKKWKRGLGKSQFGHFI